MNAQQGTILFATDFGGHSQTAFEHAVHLAAERDCRLLILHVATLPDMRGSRPGIPTHHELLRDQLDAYASDVVAIDRRLCVADPGPEICRVAAEERVLLIFMGVTSKSGIDTLGLEGVHQHVVQHAKCPVVTLCQNPTPVEVR